MPSSKASTRKLPYYGALEDTSAETDYQMVAGVIKLPKPRFLFADNEITYSQDEISDVSCTIHAAIGSYSDLLGKKITLGDRKILWGKALKKGAEEGFGWYVDKAVQLVRKEMNLAFYKLADEVITFRVGVGQEDMREALDKGYSVVTGYRGNAAYNKDYLDDGLLDGTAFSDLTYGHSIRVAKSGEDTYEIIIDSYPERKHNVYKVTWANLVLLHDNGIFFNSGYVFVLKEDYITMKQVETRVSQWAVASVEKAIKKGIMTKWENPREIIAPANGALEWSLYNLGGLTKTGLPMTKERLAVAYDRLGLLD